MTPTPLPAVPEALARRGVTLRPRREDDDALLRRLYHATRQDEPTVALLPEAMRIPFLDTQYGFQRLHYDRTYPGAAWGLVAVEGEAAGRLFLHLADRDHPGGPDLRLVDIALMPHLRGRGIGTGLLAAVQDHARALGAAKVSLHVEETNPALHLYGRLGFAPVAPKPPYWLLEWPVS